MLPLVLDGFEARAWSGGGPAGRNWDQQCGENGWAGGEEAAHPYRKAAAQAQPFVATGESTTGPLSRVVMGAGSIWRQHPALRAAAEIATLPRDRGRINP